MTVLAVHDARKSFAGNKALDGASLDLRAGERLALLGPNGAGKTTLVRAVSGRVQLDGGRLELFGEPVQPREHRDGLGFVPQEIAVYPALTARENLRAFGRLHGVPDDRLAARVDEVLEWIGLADRADEPTRRFSGGMKRRVNIACGVMHAPRIILLDEATVGVDPQSREKIYEMLEQLRGEGASILMTTHALDEAERLCDRIVIIDHGKVIAEGTMSDLVERHIGADRRVTLTLDRAPDAPLDGLESEAGNRRVTAVMQDVAGQLPGVLVAVKGGGYAIEDVEIHSPGLHAVFLELTGRELRE